MNSIVDNPLDLSPSSEHHSGLENGASLNVLVVDDHPCVCKVFARYLREMKYHGTLVSDFHSGHQELKTAAYDLALIDVELGNASGFDLLEEFIHLSPEMSFIMISGAMVMDYPVRALRGGAMGYLLKPLRFREFSEELHRVAGIRKEALRKTRETESLRSELEKRSRDLMDQMGVTSSLEKGIIQSFCRLTGYRDGETGLHIHRIADYCAVIGRSLQRAGSYSSIISEEFLSRLVATAPLHDIGKAGIPDAVLQKAGPLTPAEFEVMKSHTLIGRDTLEEILEKNGNAAVDLIRMGQDICAYHHEWWDGCGYPFELKRADIPLAARIVSIADFYDALSSTRVYRDHAFPHAEVCKMVEGLSGPKFDPIVVEAFQAAEQEILQVRNKLTEQSFV